MSLALVYARASVGIEAPLVTIEVHLANGLPAFNLVGLPETSVREAKDRVRSAMINAGFEFPAKRITVNLAPADLPKGGGRFDLAIAVGIICATGLVEQAMLDKFEFTGELALSGNIRPVKGVLPLALACRNAKRDLFLPAENAKEASLVDGIRLFQARRLIDVFHHLKGDALLPHFRTKEETTEAPIYEMDLKDIVGQSHGKRALEIAAAGGHNILLVGPPGTGKTMLANRLITLLPPMTEDQALSSATIYSVMGYEPESKNWKQRPFRQPHHTSSAVSLVGGGSIPRPGEISLAHHGVLFLDELAEFDRKVLDVMREPLESGFVCISRAAHQARFPAQFQLVAAMNPSPTGKINDGRASSEQVLRYLNKISGPFLDRIDLQVDVPKLDKQDMQKNPHTKGETSQNARRRIAKARQWQLSRNGKINNQLSTVELKQHCQLTTQDSDFLHSAIEQLGLSMRAYHRTLKVARTIADLAQTADISRHHLAEALSYRALDRLLRQLTHP